MSVTGADSVQAVLGVWLPADETLLPADMVHGRPRRHLYHHHHHGSGRALRQEQELQVQTLVQSSTFTTL